MNYILTKLEPFGVRLEPKHNDLDIEELDIAVLSKLFIENQLVVIRGFRTFKSSDDFSQYCENFGEVSIWPFGKVLELIQQESPKDHIFDNSYVPMHWDGMYRPQVPEYQIFHCLEAPLAKNGGRTIFSNTDLALRNTPTAIKDLWGKVTGSYEREMEFYNSKVVSPIISKHPFRGYSVIRYNEPHFIENGNLINPQKVEFSGIDNKQLKSFYDSLRGALYCADNSYRHEWLQSDVVIADNFTLLHGREQFVSGSTRHIQRVQVLSNPPYENPNLESYK